MTETDRNTVDQLAETIEEKTDAPTQPDAPKVDAPTADTEKKTRLLIQVNFDNCPELHGKIIADAKAAGLPNATFLQQLLAKHYDFTLPEPSKSRSADTDGLTAEEKEAVKKALAKTRTDQLKELKKQYAEQLKAAAEKARADALAKLRQPKEEAPAES